MCSGELVPCDGVVTEGRATLDTSRLTGEPLPSAIEAGSIVMSGSINGDHGGNVRAIAALAGITEAIGDLLPEDKVAAVRARIAAGDVVLMVGDGTNDAPALTATSVGIALAGHGGGVTAEVAQIVLLVDDLERVCDAIRISRRTMSIARQSVRAGLTLSGAAMIAAAFGHIPPTVGARLQEAIDIAAILNAVRASSAPRARVTRHIAGPRAEVNVLVA